MTLLISSLCFIGCVTTHQVTETDKYTEINSMGMDFRATITLLADSIKTEYKGDSLSIGRDSVRWVDPETGHGRSSVTVNLRCVRFTNRNVGALAGAVVGATPGTVLFILALITTGEAQSSYTDGPGPQGLGLESALVGAVVGAVIGALISHKTDYIF